MIRLAAGIDVCRLSNGTYGKRLIQRCLNHGVATLSRPTILSAPKTIGLAPRKALSRNISYPSKTNLEDPQKSRQISISINKNIIDLGRNQKWAEILTLYEKEKLNFDSVNYATVMSQLGRFSKIHIDDPKFKAFLVDMYSCIRANGIRWIGPRNLSNITHAIGKMGLQSNTTSMKLLGILEEKDNAEWMFQNGNSQGIANCVWACGKLEIQSPNLFRLLELNAEWMFENATPQGIANSVWACGSLGIQSPNLFRILEENAEWMYENATSQGIANCVWACGSLGIQSPNLFRILDKNAEWMFQKGNSQEISNCIWACGTLEIQSLSLFGLLEQNAEWMFENATPQSIANCVWACGKHEIQSPKFFKLLEKNAEWMFENENSQEIANCVWACGSLEIQSPNLFRQLDINAEWMFENGNSQEIANCVWACGKLEINSPNLFRLLEKNSEWMFENGNLQEIANCVWACGKHEIKSPNLFRLVEKYAEWMIENDTPQGIANCIWACGKLEIQSPNLFRLLERNAEWLFHNGNSQEIANCMLTLSSLGWNAPRIVEALEEFLFLFLGNADSQALVNVCYALAMHEGDSDTVERLIPQIWNVIMKSDFRKLSEDYVTQILYIQSYAEAYDIQLAPPSLELKVQLDTFSQRTKASSFEDGVSKLLISMGFPHEREVSPFNSRPGFLSIDIACVDRMIAIECDGPSHFVSVVGDSKRMIENGATKAKRRLLQQLGWKVINLSWMEFATSKNSHSWLKQMLNEAHADL